MWDGSYGSRDLLEAYRGGAPTDTLDPDGYYDDLGGDGYFDDFGAALDHLGHDGPETFGAGPAGAPEEAALGGVSVLATDAFFEPEEDEAPPCGACGGGEAGGGAGGGAGGARPASPGIAAFLVDADSGARPASPGITAFLVDADSSGRPASPPGRGAMDERELEVSPEAPEGFGPGGALAAGGQGGAPQASALGGAASETATEAATGGAAGGAPRARRADNLAAPVAEQPGSILSFMTGV